MPGQVTQANDGRGTIRLDTGLEVETAIDGITTGERCHAVVRPEKLEIRHASEPARDGLPERRGRGRELGLSRHLHPDRRADPG